MGWNLKIFLSSFKSASSNLSCCKIWCKNKNPYIWDQKCLILVFLGWHLKKLIWNQHPEICLIANFAKKKMSKFRTKNVSFGYFSAGIYKKYCHIWNQHPWICLIAKYCEILKMQENETKSALFGYFWARILNKLLSYLKSAPSN